MTAARDRIGLVAFIESRTARPHDWDGNCCCRFVLDAVAAQFGSAPEPSVRWRTERGAKRAIAKVGGIAKECDRLFEPIAPAEAQFGDIAGYEGADGFALALVEGPTLAAPGVSRLERVPRAAMTLAWRARGGDG